MSHIAPISMSVATTLSAYRIVTCLTATANAVKYPAALTEMIIGVTVDDVLDTNVRIPVAIAGIAKVLFNDTCASGAMVTADSSGRGIPYVNNTAGGFVLGPLVGPKVDATGTIADVLIQPHWKIIT
jgi:hypothetical protein